MDTQKPEVNCQIGCLPSFFTGYAEVPPESLARKMRLLIRRSLNARQVRIFKRRSSELIDQFLDLMGIRKKSIVPEFVDSPAELKPGDRVRVRSKEEIKATLDHWGRLKGCMFMPEMQPYCRTTQQVFKRLERFMDERDYFVKKTHGIILLKGLHCEGTSDYGRCDRSCFYFWREEWLEKINEDNSKEINTEFEPT